jgi:transcriptional regulator
MSPAPLFTVTDPVRLRAFVRAHPFATIAAARPGGGAPVLAHVPCLLDDEPRPRGALRFHTGLHHPLVGAIGAGADVVVVFHGPDGYVSPAWYREPTVHVPTWNYEVVHAEGPATPLGERNDALRLLADLSRAHEDPRPAWTMASLDPALRDELVTEIRCFRVRLARLEGIFKLSQNREPADRVRVQEAFRRRGRDDDREMADEMSG